MDYTKNSITLLIDMIRQMNIVYCHGTSLCVYSDRPSPWVSAQVQMASAS